MSEKSPWAPCTHVERRKERSRGMGERKKGFPGGILDLSDLCLLAGNPPWLPAPGQSPAYCFNQNPLYLMISVTPPSSKQGPTCMPRSSLSLDGPRLFPQTLSSHASSAQRSVSSHAAHPPGPCPLQKGLPQETLSTQTPCAQLCLSSLPQEVLSIKVAPAA